jgi:hypothetical protein
MGNICRHMSEGSYASEPRHQWCQMKLLLRKRSRDFAQVQRHSILPGNLLKPWRSFSKKMVEYIRPDNYFRQRREESYRYSEMTRGFGGRLHPRHVRTIHNPSQSENKNNRNKGQQRSSQLTGAQQSSFRPPTPRGRGGRGFGGRNNSQPRRLFCLFCGEDKGHTTRTCQVMIQKQKEIAEAEAQQNQPK